MDLLWVMRLNGEKLQGYVLTVVTKNLYIMEFLYNNTESLELKDIVKLLKLCEQAKWSEGVLSIISSPITKAQFILS
jgi:hypothetical protein